MELHSPTSPEARTAFFCLSFRRNYSWASESLRYLVSITTLLQVKLKLFYLHILSLLARCKLWPHWTQQMTICIAAGKSAYINGWKSIQWGNGVFSLMKNHTKYFSNRIKIFNLKKKKKFWYLVTTKLVGQHCPWKKTGLASSFSLFVPSGKYSLVPQGTEHA